MQDFIQTLADSHIYLFDGAMGTMLYSRGRLHQPVLRRAESTRAGSRPRRFTGNIASPAPRSSRRIPTARTASSCARSDSTGELAEINQRGAELAREAAGDSACVAGAIGPLGIRLEPYGPTALDEARQYFREQIEALVAGGVNLILLETFSSLAEIEQAILAARDADLAPRRRADDHRHRLPHHVRRRAGGDRPPTRRRRRRRHRPQLLGRPRHHARRGREDGCRHGARRSPRSRTPACRARSAAGRCTWRRPSTWPNTASGSFRRESSSWAAAAGPRPSTSA